MTHVALIACSIFAQDPAQEPASSSPRVHKIAVGGEGGWDYLTVDPDARRLYVSRGNRVVVIDLDTVQSFPERDFAIISVERLTKQTLDFRIIEDHKRLVDLAGDPRCRFTSGSGSSPAL